MKDQKSASLIAAIAGVAFILWYRSRSEAQRVALTRAGGVTTKIGDAYRSAFTPSNSYGITGMQLVPVPPGTPVPTLHLP